MTEPTREHLEQRLVESEARSQRAELDAARTRIAVRHGIDLDDAEVLLSATDEVGMMDQAQRIQERLAEALQADLVRGNVARREGSVRETGKHHDEETRDFAQDFFSGGIW